MAKTRANEDGARPNTVMGYFRSLFQENPKWVHERSNDKLTERWLADNPGQTEMPRNIRNTMANLKSSLRKHRRKRGRPRKTEVGAGMTSATPTAPRLAPRGLEALEIQIDECLSMARNFDRAGLDDVIKLLRRARNEVVWKSGQ